MAPGLPEALLEVPESPRLVESTVVPSETPQVSNSCAHGGIVGFIASIAPDFATRQLVFFLAKWKSLQFERAKLNELKLFALISRIHAGKRDRYIFLQMGSQIAAVAIFSVGIPALVFFLLKSTDALKKLTPVYIRFQSPIVAFMELILSIGMFVLLFSFSARFFKRLLSIQRKLFNYEEYRRGVIHQWGKEEVSSIEAEL
jgi:hypothetical protein